MRARAALLALAATGCGSEPTEPAAPPAAEPAGLFRDATAASGLAGAVHAPARTPERRLPEIMGSGVALADFDRDGAPDVFLVGGGDLRSPERPAAARDTLWLNDGRGRFRDATDEWRVPSRGYGMGVAAGDADGDGRVDLFLTAFGPGQRLLGNTGARLEDRTAAAGLPDDDGWGTSAGFLDADQDGDLDLYVVRYVAYVPGVSADCWQGPRRVYCTPAQFDAQPDRLWRNRGDGTFEEAGAEVGLDHEPTKGLAIVLGDVDLDGDPDAFVAGDTTRNLLLVNDGSGRFAERGQLAGVAYDDTGREAAGMGADLGDVDGDGRPDLVCTNFQGETTNVFVQTAPGVYRDRSWALGLGESARQRLSFGVDLLDVDDDGDLDLAIANGHIDDGIDELGSGVTFAQLCTLALNEGGRLRDASAEGGAPFRTPGVFRGLASGDLDGDTRLDLVLTRNGGPPLVALNAGEGPPRAIVLWLEGRAPNRGAQNRGALGARVEAEVAGRTVAREVRGASSYLSTCDTRVHVGLGEAPAAERVRVRWPDGALDEARDLAPGHWRWVQGAEPERYVPGERRWDP